LPGFQLGDLIENLARRGKLISHPEKLAQPPQSIQMADDRAIGRWVDRAAGHLGLEAEPVDTYYADFETLLQAGDRRFALTRPLADDQPLLLGLVRAGKKKATLLAPDFRSRRIAIHAIHQAMFQVAEDPLNLEIERLIQEANIAENRLERARRAILKEQLGSLRVQCGWLLRFPPGVKLLSQLRHAGAIRPAVIVLVMYLVQVFLSIATWYVIGRGVFQGHFDRGWLLAWGILLFATIPVQLIVNDAQSELSMRSGAVFKQRLLSGTLRLEPEEIRHQGMGQFLGRVMESEAVEMLGLSGGFLALLSFIELFWAILILANGAGGSLPRIIVGWILIVLAILWRYFQIKKNGLRLTGYDQ
jgi:ATP-binding cassette subfamily B protein